MTKTFFAPSSLDEALEILARTASAQTNASLEILAGGTDLFPKWNSGVSRPARVLSLHRLAELRGISLDEEWLSIGAACTHSEIIRSEAVRRACPSLAEAAASIGAVQIQNRGTLGGNVVNASPAADLVPPLVAASSILELASARGPRRVPIGRFFLGYRTIDRAPDELLVRVLVPPLPTRAVEHFRKVGTRRAQAISKVVGSSRLALSSTGEIALAGIALGSVAPTVIRLETVEGWLLGRMPSDEVAADAGRLASDYVSPIDDVRSSAAYRRHIVGRFVESWIRDLGANR